MVTITDLNNTIITKIERVEEAGMAGYKIFFENVDQEFIIHIPNCELNVQDVMTRTVHGSSFTVDMTFKGYPDRRDQDLWKLTMLRDKMDIETAKQKLTELLGYEINISN